MPHQTIMTELFLGSGSYPPSDYHDLMGAHEYVCVYECRCVHMGVCTQIPYMQNFTSTKSIMVLTNLDKKV